MSSSPQSIEAGQWDRVIDFVNKEVFDKPEEFYSLEKLRKAAAVDRRLTLREILEKIFGLIPRFKSKDELLEEEFAKFVADAKPDEPAEIEAIPAMKTFFKAYASSDQVRHIIESGELTDLATNPVFLLDNETKRRIDTARDILVGKVPDPKSQVEQITIALIYKFMDDMDAEAEELGGKRNFFVGEYEKYSWAKLMAPGRGGHEVLNLYGEAITQMTQNEGIPRLFRDIFKNAYLPYRDPETLKSFLKIINAFTYDHSEKLGDAFEYLLSVLGSQGDAGQFRTPRHIIDFMVQVIDPKKDDTILDPACGTAGFLISSYKHIMAANAKNGRSGAALTPDERTRLLNNIQGYDISPDMVRLSLVNLYLHGFTDPHIYEYDTLTSDDRWNEYFDIIMANPPFMSPKGGIRPHKRFSVESKRSEVLFVDYIAEHLSPNGRAAVIVPEGIIFQGERYRENGTSNSSFPMVELGEVITLQRGYDLPKQEWREGTNPIVGSNGIIGYHSEWKEVGPGVVTGRSGTIGKVHFIDAQHYWPHNTSLFVKDFKGNEPKFVKVLLEAIDLKSLGERTAAVPSLDRKNAHKVKVPLPPLEAQKEIVSEIEGYQKVINGARAVLDHYRPHIPIHPDWPEMPLGEVCRFIDYRGKDAGENCQRHSTHHSQECP
jgi:hypothetical protein